MPTATADPTATDPAAPAAPAAPGRWRHRLAAAACRPVDAASTVAFRVAFGLLVAFAMVRFLARGWVETLYLAPEHHLTYARFEWVRPLPGPLMYALVVALALLGIAIAVGFHHRAAALAFAIGFAYTDLIDAALYLNHHWYVTLAAVGLALAPPPRGGRVPKLTVWALRGQLAVVYTFAGIAKLNPDWLLHAQPMHIWLSARTDRPIVGPWLDEPAVAHLLSWMGAAFDLTIVGWLLWRRSRPVAYLAVIGFHVATAMLFQIGVFPWVMIALTPIFFEPGWPRRLHRRLTGRTPPPVTQPAPATQPVRIGRPTFAVFGAVAVMNLVLPLRHYAAAGNVRFNDDGYYLSWRVMLTDRAGFLAFDVTDPATGETWTVRPDLVLTEWQAAQASRRPDLALATAHLVADELARRGHPGVEVHANSWVSFNGRPRQRWIDPAVDLAATPRHAHASAYVLPPER